MDNFIMSPKIDFAFKELMGNDWIKFIKAEDKEEFKMSSKENEYLKTAYETLEEISADQQKRLE